MIHLTDKMSQQSHTIHLYPWISIHKNTNSSCALRYIFNNQQLSHEEVITIAILSIKQQTLSLLGQFTLHQQQNNASSIAYISPLIQMHNQFFQIAYVPYQETKHDAECMQSISNILKQSSEIIVTDVSYCGAHKYKERRPSESGDGRQFVIVNNNDIYQIQMKESKIELTKKVQFSLQNKSFLIPETNSMAKSVRLDIMSTIMIECIEQFVQFLNNEKNWRTLTDFVTIRYKTERHLDDCFDLQDGMTRKILTRAQMETIENEVINFGGERSGTAQWIASSIIKKMHHQNSNKVDVLLELREQFTSRQVQNQEQLQSLAEEVKNVLDQYELPNDFTSFLLSSQQQHLQHKQREQLAEKQQILKQMVMQRNNQLMLKAHKIDQLKDIIREFADKAEEMKHNTQQLIEISQLYEEEKQKNWKLQLEVDSHNFIAKKNAENKISLENQIQIILKEKADLLLGLQELTTDNLSLMSERQVLRQEIKDLKDRIEDTNLVQARALKSIQNEAEIKVRLNRYQNYVQQLKQVFTSFKRLQIQKFNCILQMNYKQYEELQERHRFLQFQLRRSQGKVKELSESLHCERIKMNYFEKMYANNYTNQPIPEVSEENSATDREIAQST